MAEHVCISCCRVNRLLRRRGFLEDEANERNAVLITRLCFTYELNQLREVIRWILRHGRTSDHDGEEDRLVDKMQAAFDTLVQHRDSYSRLHESYRKCSAS